MTHEPSATLTDAEVEMFRADLAGIIHNTVNVSLMFMIPRIENICAQAKRVNAPATQRSIRYWQDLACANRKAAEDAQAQRDKAVEIDGGFGGSQRQHMTDSGASIIEKLDNADLRRALNSARELTKNLQLDIQNLKRELVGALAEIAALKAKELNKFEPDWANFSFGREAGYAEAQEQAAKVCDKWSKRNDDVGGYCAAAIRAMIKGEIALSRQQPLDVNCKVVTCQIYGRQIGLHYCGNCNVIAEAKGEKS